jgi:rubredoxin
VEKGYGSHLRDVNRMGRWVCSVCDYEYNEEAGDPDAGIPPGTRFEDLPDDWQCPGCRIGKEACVRVDGADEPEMNEDDYL